MIDLSKVEAIIAEAEKSPTSGSGTLAATINALSEDERRDLAGVVYFGNGEYVTYEAAYVEAQKILSNPDDIAGDLLTLMTPLGLARDLRAGVSFLRGGSAENA